MALDPDKFIFHIKFAPLSIPKSFTPSITSGSVIPANSDQVTYSAWEDVGPGTYANKNLFKYGSTEYPDFALLNVTGSGSNVLNVQPYVEYDGSRVRLVLVVKNANAVTVTYTPVTINATIHMYHMAQQ